MHRVIGRPGVIFVAEGSPAQVRHRWPRRRKRTARLIGEVPIYDVIVGSGEGEVPLSKLERHLTKLPPTSPSSRWMCWSQAGRAGHQIRSGLYAEGPDARSGQNARRAAHRAPPLIPPLAADDRRPRRTVLHAPAVGIGEQCRDGQRDQQPRTTPGPSRHAGDCRPESPSTPARTDRA